MRSIRARLLTGLLLVMAAASLLAGGIAYRRALHETSDLFDYQLRQMALSLRDEASVASGIVLPPHAADSDFVIQIWDLSGSRIYFSGPSTQPFIDQAILGYADLVFMSATARLKCPFTSLGVAPEAASSYLLPQLVGRQNAAWMLLSSEWIDAEQAKSMGLAWQICAPDALLPEARRHAEVLASRPIPSLIAVKQTMVEPTRAEITAAAAREYAQFAELLGGVANADALAAFADRRASS